MTGNLGLRWEYFGSLHNFKSNIDSNVYFGSTATPAPMATNNIFFPNTPFYASMAMATIQVRNHVHGLVANRNILGKETRETVRGRLSARETGIRFTAD